MRNAQISRKTAETDVTLSLDLDGGARAIDTGCGFLNHMLELFAVHSGYGFTVCCVGDSDVDFHHTTEDVELRSVRRLKRRSATNAALRGMLI